MSKKEITKSIEVLTNTIKWFKKQIEPHDCGYNNRDEAIDCGWMYTTIDGLKHKIQSLRSELRKISKR